MVTATLRKPAAQAATPPADTSHLPVDENAADRLAHELGVGPTFTAEVVPAGETQTASTAVTVRRDVAGSGIEGIEGEVDASDLRVPRFQLVNGSGELAKKFNQGVTLYADEVLFGIPDLQNPANNPVLRFIPVKVKTQYRENLTKEEMEEGMTSRIVDTLQEAQACGGGVGYSPDGVKLRWQKTAKFLLLLEEPANCKHPGFVIEADGKRYAPAVYYCSGGAYSRFFTPIYSKTKMQAVVPGKAAMLEKFVWTMKVVRTTGGKFSVWVPEVNVLREESGPEIRHYAAALRGSTVREDGEASE